MGTVRATYLKHTIAYIRNMVITVKMICRYQNFLMKAAMGGYMRGTRVKKNVKVICTVTIENTFRTKF